MLGIIKRNFRGLRQETFICYTNTSFDLSWSMLTRYGINPYQKQDIKALEKVQMRATRLVTA